MAEKQGTPLPAPLYSAGAFDSPLHPEERINPEQVRNLPENLAELAARAAEKLDRAGDEMSGPLGVPSPTSDSHATPRGWVRGRLMTFPTMATAQAEAIPGGIKVVQVLRWDDVGDGIAARWRRVSSPPSHMAAFQDAAGAWWELAERSVDPRMLGARVDGTTNDVGALLSAWSLVVAYSSATVGDQYPGARQRELYIPPGRLLARPLDNVPTGQVVLTTALSVGTGVSIRGDGPQSVLDGPAIELRASNMCVRNLQLIDTRPAIRSTRGSFGLRINGARGAEVTAVSIRDRWVGYDGMAGGTHRFTACNFNRNYINAWLRGAGDTEFTNCHAMNGTYGWLRAHSGEVKFVNCRARDNTVANHYVDGIEPGGNVENYVGMLTSTSSIVFRTMASQVVAGDEGRARFITSPLLSVTALGALANPNIVIGGDVPVGTDANVRIRFTGVGDISSIRVGDTEILASTVAWTGDITTMQAAIVASINAAAVVAGEEESVEAALSGRIFITVPADWIGRAITITTTGTLALTDPRRFVVVTTSTPHGLSVADDVHLDCGADWTGIERVCAVIDSTSFVVQATNPGTRTGTACRPNRLHHRMGVTISASSVSAYNSASGSTRQIYRAGPNWMELWSGAGATDFLSYQGDATCTVSVPGWDTIYDGVGGGINDTFQLGGNDNFTLIRGAYNFTSLGARWKSSFWFDPRLNPSGGSARTLIVGTSRGRQRGTYSDNFPSGSVSGYGGLTVSNDQTESLPTPTGDYYNIWAPHAAHGLQDGRPKSYNRVGATADGICMEIAGVRYTLGEAGGALYGHTLLPGGVGVGLIGGSNRALLASQSGGVLAGDLAISAGASGRIALERPVVYGLGAAIIAADDVAAIEAGVPRYGQYFLPTGGMRVRVAINDIVAPNLQASARNNEYLRNFNSRSPAVEANALTGEYSRKMQASTFSADLTFARASTGLYTASGGTMTEAPANQVRMDRRGPALDAQGWLIETALTNQVTNPRAEGAVAGTPGTMPTGWSSGITATVDGLQRSIAPVTEDGIPALEVRVWGTATATRSDRLLVLFMPSTSIPAGAGQVWTGQFRARLKTGATATLPSGLFSARLSARDASGNAVSGGTFNTVLSLTTAELRSQRHATTATLPALTERVFHGLGLSYTTGDSIDCTVIVALPCLAASGSAGSVPLPVSGSPAVSTRAADRLRLSDEAFSQIGATKGTVIVEWLVPAVTSNYPARPILQLDNGTNDNAVGALISAGGSSVVGAVTVSGSTQYTASAGTAVSGTVHRVGLRWDSSGVYICMDGGQLRPFVGTMPSGMTALRWGGNADGSLALDGFIRDYAVWSYKLSDTELQAACVPGASWPG